AFGADNIAPLAKQALEGAPLRLPGGTAETISFIGITVIVAFVTLILGELVPKTLGIERAEPIALRVSGFVTGLAVVARPVVSLLTGTTNVVLWLLGAHHKAHIASISEEEI